MERTVPCPCGSLRTNTSGEPEVVYIAFLTTDANMISVYTWEDRMDTQTVVQKLVN
jgi:hypothetical protein